VGYSLLLSPLIGFFAAALLLLSLKVVARRPELYQEPHGTTPPPFWIRGLLIMTCTGVSFAHGSNDGQKGMGLIMLILIGVVPTAYALNRSMPDSDIQPFLVRAAATAEMLDRYGDSRQVDDPEAVIGTYLETARPEALVVPALAQMTRNIGTQVGQYGSIRRLPADAVENIRNQMFMVSETVRHLSRSQVVKLENADADLLYAFTAQLDTATRYIPVWVKIAVAIALGLGTMVGWKRIVITVGEKIGKSHLTYAQGASAELVAATTIAAADLFGMPVSTTQVLSSGVAGTMAASRAGLQLATVRNLMMAWVLTLPAAIVLSGGLFWLFVQLL
jgi:PiT family inorganic phosphate transporter